jgi:MFS family permease
VALTFVSMLTDVSSEMTLTVLPLFLADVLAVKTVLIGLIEGVAEATASITRIFSGWLSDRWGKRKGLTIIGYGLSAVSKPFLLIAGSWVTVLGVRFSDRLGKGVRTAPRDALLADSTPDGKRGLSFGFHRAGDTAGAFLGLSAVALIVFLREPVSRTLTLPVFRLLVLVAIVPAFLAVALLAGLVAERPIPRKAGPPPALTLRGFDPWFKRYLLVIIIFTLGNSSDAFLILRSRNLGLSIFHVVLVLVLFNLVFTVISVPAGAWSDRVGRRRVILLGWTVYALVYLGFGLARAPWQAWALFAVYGIYHGMAEGAERALVADLVGPERRGTAYGLYNTVVGVVALPASVIAGLLWQGVGGWKGFGAPAPFLFGAVMAGIAAILFWRWIPPFVGTRRS